MRERIFYLLLWVAIPLGVMAQKKGSYTLDFSVKDKDTREAVIMATIQLQPTLKARHRQRKVSTSSMAGNTCDRIKKMKK